MNTKQVILIFLGLAALAAADSHESFEYASRRDSSEESNEASYDFNWLVKHDPSRNNCGHHEIRKDDSTLGSYFVYLPDGRLQTVKYYVDGDSGYLAEVTYDGRASFESGSVESRERPRYYFDSNESK